jgi:hypothetical protein
MTPECRKVSEHLDIAPDEPLSVQLSAHATQCPVCRRQVAIERDLRQGLGAGTKLDPARRAALLDQIAGAWPMPIVRRRNVIVRWLWLPATAAVAAAVLLAVFHHPAKTVIDEPNITGAGGQTQVGLNPVPTPPKTVKSRPAIPPTQILANWFGPMTEATKPLTSSTVNTTETTGPAAGVLLSLLGDLDGPVAIARGALEAPRAEPSVTNPAGAKPASNK